MVGKNFKRCDFSKRTLYRRIKKFKNLLNPDRGSYSVGNGKFYFVRFWSHLCIIIQGDSDVFSIKQNLNSLHQGEHRFSHAFFTKVFHFRDNRKNVQF